MTGEIYWLAPPRAALHRAPFTVEDLPMIALYYSPGACSLAPHIALEEAGAAFEPRRVAIAAGEHRRPEYLAVNPHGFVPALEVDGAVITENIAILAWIAAAFPKAGLLPFGEPLALARRLQRMAFLSSSLHIAFAQTWRAERFTPDESAHAAIVAGGRARILAYFDEIEATLSASDYFAGERYSLADPYLFVFFRWGNRIGLDMARPAWTAHSRRLLERSAVRRAIEREGLAEAEFLPAA